MQHAHDSYGCYFGRAPFAGQEHPTTPKWDKLATDVAVYFDSKLRMLKLQTYQSISPAKVREKPPDNAENWENGV